MRVPPPRKQRTHRVGPHFRLYELWRSPNHRLVLSFSLSSIHHLLKPSPRAIPESEALPLLKAAYDAGLNTWDTANAYSNGASEIIVGKAIKQYDIPRHKVVIMTKCNFAVGETPDLRAAFFRSHIAQSKDYVNNFGLSRTAIFNQVEASLKRLDTPYIDVLQIHRWDPDTPPEETMRALHDLVLSGKVRYLGASSMWATQFARLQFIAEKNGWTKFVSMQNHYNLLYREEEREMNRFCKDTGVALIPWAPLCRGHLARRPEVFGETKRSAQEKESQKGSHGTVEPDLSIIGRVVEIADKRGWPVCFFLFLFIHYVSFSHFYLCVWKRERGTDSDTFTRSPTLRSRGSTNVSPVRLSALAACRGWRRRLG